MKALLCLTLVGIGCLQLGCAASIVIHSTPAHLRVTPSEPVSGIDRRFTPPRKRPLLRLSLASAGPGVPSGAAGPFFQGDAL